MKKQKIIKIILLLLSLAGICVGIYFILKSLGITDVEGIRSIVEKCGVWGWLVFMLLFVTVSVLLCFIPGTSAVFIGVGVVMFGSLKAFLICSSSVIISSSLMFLIGKTLGEKTVAKLVGKENLKKAQELIDIKSKIFLPLMFLFPVFPDDALCCVAGMTKMKYWYFLIVVSIFRTVGVATICFLGSGFIDWTALSIIDWFVLVNICVFDIFIIFKLSNKLEQKIKNKQGEKMSRGVLTKEIQQKAKQFLGREITQTELRLYPYLSYCLVNCGIIERAKINNEERNIIEQLSKEGHVKRSSIYIYATKEFYDFINEVIWDIYVETKLLKEGEINE